MLCVVVKLFGVCIIVVGGLLGSGLVLLDGLVWFVDELGIFVWVMFLLL